MPISSEQFARAEELYFEARNLPSDEWPAFLDRQADDDTVKDEVRALLGLDQRTDVVRPLQRAMDAALRQAPPGGAAREAARPPHKSEAQRYIGRSIGPYRIEQQIGEGGMGVVFRAQQQEPVQRTVALKLIRAGMDSPDVVARFELERQALAMMSHPHVARVFDAGTTDEGRHYFVMEYVAHAQPITAWCDLSHASIEQRLRLFIDVCAAVHHAHQRGVIHRDLKPTNVLVSTVDGKPVPKVIDFGVAKAVEPPVGAATVTHAGQLIGTPEYMSPEQAELGSQDVDTRSDIYTLGVILYELMTGAPPLDRGTMRDKGLDHVLRVIRQLDPPRPSTRVQQLLTRDDAAATELARRRHTEPTRLARQLRGELDWIICKALEKDRERRYASAAELADDLQRYLENEPVRAGPPSTLYRFRKFVRRHRVPVAASVLLALVILAGAIATTWLAVRATRAERVASRRFNDIRKLADTVLFDLDETLRTRGPTKTRQLVVTKALAYLDALAGEGGDDLELRRDVARGYRRVGNIQYSRTMIGGGGSLGDLAGALRSYHKAVELARDVALARPDAAARRDLAHCLLFLGDTLAAQEDFDAAMHSYDEARFIFGSLAAANPEDRFALRHLGVTLDRRGQVLHTLGRRDEALLSFTESLNLREKWAREMPDDQQARMDVAMSRQILATFHDRDANRADEARHMEEMLPAVRAMLAQDPDNPRRQHDLLEGLLRLAELRFAREEVAESTALLAEAMPLADKLLRNDPDNAVAQDDMARALALHAYTLANTNRAKEAVEPMERALAMRRAMSDSHGELAGRRIVAEALVAMARVYRSAGRLDEALLGAREAVELHEHRVEAQATPASRRSLASALDLLIELCDAAGNPAEAAAARSRRGQIDPPTTAPEL